MIILAGGKSSRMGTDKAELMWDGKTFLETQIEKGQALGITDILLSGYRGERFSAEQEEVNAQKNGKIAVVKDRIQERGPLGGLEACLRAAKNPYCLVLSVDVPLVPAEELLRLLESASGEITILKNNGKEQPLIGVYVSALADRIEEELKTGNGSVFAFLNKNGYCVYESTADQILFENVNDPEIYRKMLRFTN